MQTVVRLHDWRNNIPSSYGQGGFGRAYETLRKRSYRRHQKWLALDREFDRMMQDPWPSYDEEVAIIEELQATLYDTDHHHIYLQGVRDALEAVRLGLTE
jgi:hypothetical protein